MTPEQVKQIVTTILKSQGVKDSMLGRVQTAQGTDLIPVLQGGENVLLPMQWILDVINEAITSGVEIDTDGFSEDPSHVPSSTLVKFVLDNKSDKNNTYTKNDVDDKIAKFSYHGTKGERPEDVPIGRQFFDETLNKPIWWNGQIWVDYNGEPADLQIIGKTSYLVDAGGGKSKIFYAMPEEATLQVESDQSWLSCIDNGGIIMATAETNDGPARTAHVVLQCGNATKSILFLQLSNI